MPMTGLLQYVCGGFCDGSKEGGPRGLSKDNLSTQIKRDGELDRTGSFGIESRGTAVRSSKKSVSGSRLTPRVLNSYALELRFFT